MWPKPFSIGLGRWRDGRLMQLQDDRKQIADFCIRRHIRRLALFGSALRDAFRPDSDL
jgi:predicted nucleotidyltransferase